MRTMRVVRATGAVVFLLVVFCLALVASVWIHLDTAPARALVVGAVNRVLTSEFRGAFHIERIEHLGLGSVRGVHGSIAAPTGERVLCVVGLDAKVALRPLIDSVSQRRALVVQVERVRLREAEVLLDADAQGNLLLATAFAPVHASPAATEPSEPVTVTVEPITADRLWVHRHASGGPALDAKLLSVKAAFRMRESIWATAKVDAVHVDAPLPAPAGGRLDGTFELAPDNAIHATGAFVGTLGDVPLALQGSVHRDVVHAEVHMPETKGHAMKSVLPGLAIPSAVALDARVDGPPSAMVFDLVAAAGIGRLSSRGVVSVVEPIAIEGTFGITELNLADVVSGAPPSALSAHGDAAVTLEPQGPAGRAQIVVQPGKVAGQNTPRVDVRATARAGRGDAVVHVEEPGVRADIALAFRQDGENGPTLSFDATAEAPQLERVSRLGVVVSGDLRLASRGRAEMSPWSVAAEIDVSSTSLRSAAGNWERTRAGLSFLYRDDVMTFRRLRLSSHAHGAEIVLTAPSAEVSASSGKIASLRIEGAGEPIEAALRWDGERVRASAQANRVDLTTLAPFVGEDPRTLGGHVRVQGAVDVRRDRFDARADIAWDSVAVRGLHNLQGSVHAELADNHLVGDLAISWGPAARIAATFRDIELAGDPRRVSSWARAVGRADLDAEADLDAVFAQLPPHVRPEQDRVPPVPWGRVASHLSMLKTAQTATVHGDAALSDPLGKEISLNVEASLPVDGLARATDLATWRDAPFDIRVDVPRRALDRLPLVTMGERIPGEVALSANVAGTLRSFRGKVDARAYKLESLLLRGPVDISATGQYDGQEATASVSMVRGNRHLVHAQARWSGVLFELLEYGETAWSADGDARFDEFPLQILSALAERRLRGQLSGNVSLHDWHRRAHLAANLDVDNLRIGAASLGRVHLGAQGDDGAIRAFASVVQPVGCADVSLGAHAAWTDELMPRVDMNSASIDYRFDNFRIAALRPLVAEQISRLDGVVGGQGRIGLATGHETIEGNLTYEDGRIQLPNVGEELHDVQAAVRLRRDGLIELHEASARGTTGRVAASGWAKLNGLRFDHAAAAVRIGREERLPLLLEGEPIGEVWGNANLRASAQGNSLVLSVDVPQLGIDLPEVSTHEVQSLDSDPTIRVGVRAPDGTFVPVAIGKPDKDNGEGTSVQVAVWLGSVEIRRTNTLRVGVSGKIDAHVTDATSLTGELRLKPGGHIEVQGRKFVVDQGTVSFDESPPGNPTIVARAYYDAPDRTRIIADFYGPLDGGSVTLRSEPARSKNEILSLLLFGAPDAAVGTPAPRGRESSAGVQAVAVGGGFLTGSLNHWLSSRTPFEITTRVASNESRNPRPEVGVQLSQSVAARIGYNMGLPAPGQAPDRTMLMIDWRFTGRWMLSTTVGDRGSSIVDLLWIYRY